MSRLTRRGFLSATAGGAAALGLGVARRATGTRTSPPAARPNIILAMTDDQGWAGVGYEGVFPFLRTPHLDEMARSAVRFDRFYAAAPWCSPTRVSCMTGRCPARSNSHKPGDGLQPQDRTIAQVLRAQGYATGHFGKWHLGRPGPEGRGYEECLWTGNNVGHVDPTYTGAKGEKVKLQGEDCDLLVGRTLDFARRAGAAGRPFFVTLWFHVPHSPYGTTPEFEALYADLPEGKRAFWGQLSALDASMGKLRAGLRDLKVAENTLLWFHSDNGGVGGTSGDLRAAKGSLYEGGRRSAPRRWTFCRRSSTRWGWARTWPSSRSTA
jgi:arylsulfatase A-like enzyme